MSLNHIVLSISAVLFYPFQPRRLSRSGMSFYPFQPYCFIHFSHIVLSVSAMSFYRRTDDVSADMEEMDTEHQNESSDSKESFTVKELLTQRGLVLPLLIACALQVVQQFSGINAVSVTSTLFSSQTI